MGMAEGNGEGECMSEIHFSPIVLFCLLVKHARVEGSFKGKVVLLVVVNSRELF
jgi:hypothetical protein